MKTSNQPFTKPALRKLRSIPESERADIAARALNICNNRFMAAVNLDMVERALTLRAFENHARTVSA